MRILILFSVSQKHFDILILETIILTAQIDPSFKARISTRCSVWLWVREWCVKGAMWGMRRETETYPAVLLKKPPQTPKHSLNQEWKDWTCFNIWHCSEDIFVRLGIKKEDNYRTSHPFQRKGNSKYYGLGLGELLISGSFRNLLKKNVGLNIVYLILFISYCSRRKVCQRSRDVRMWLLPLSSYFAWSRIKKTLVLSILSRGNEKSMCYHRNGTSGAMQGWNKFHLKQ